MFYLIVYSNTIAIWKLLWSMVMSWLRYEVYCYCLMGCPLPTEFSVVLLRHMCWVLYVVNTEYSGSGCECGHDKSTCKIIINVFVIMLSSYTVSTLVVESAECLWCFSPGILSLLCLLRFFIELDPSAWLSLLGSIPCSLSFRFAGKNLILF